MRDELFQRLDELYPELVDFRRDLHMHPELSFQEERTPHRIAAFLRELGLEVRTAVGGRGVVGVLRGGKPGSTVALRADFDALPIQDQKDVPYRSTVPGVMHACGHDVHTAGLLGVAKVLSEVRERIEGDVVFIHQFAEELPPGGAISMIEDGCLDGVDVIYGAHVHSPLEYGKVATREGPTMAAADAFTVEITGKGGHGARPHDAVDPIVIGSHLVLSLQQIVSRQVDPLDSAVITVGAMNAGNAFNVIPDTATLKGTVRAFDPGVRDRLEEAIGKLVQSIPAAFGASGKLDYQVGYPAVVNDSAETRRLDRLATELLGEENVQTIRPAMGGEDFAYYLQKVPGSFFFVGGRNEELDAVYPHHNAMFDVDERSMLVTGRLFVSAVLDYQSQNGAARKAA